MKDVLNGNFNILQCCARGDVIANIRIWSFGCAKLIEFFNESDGIHTDHRSQ